jgi:hypothetical protein
MAKGVKGSSPKEESKPKRTSFNIYPIVQKKIKTIAFTDDKDITMVVDEALNDYIRKWEKKNGFEIKIR